MIIKVPLSIKGSKGKKKLSASFDLRSKYSCIQKDLAEKLGNIDKLPESLSLYTTPGKQYLKAEHGMCLNFELNDLNLSDEFMVVDNLSEEAIIGVTTMQKWRIKLDFEHDSVVVDPKVAKFILKSGKGGINHLLADPTYGLFIFSKPTVVTGP